MKVGFRWLFVCSFFRATSFTQATTVFLDLWNGWLAGACIPVYTTLLRDAGAIRIRKLMRISRKGIPITDSHFWQDEEECTLEVLQQVFRSSTSEEMPLLPERLACLREAGKVLYEVCPPPLGSRDTHHP